MAENRINSPRYTLAAPIGAGDASLTLNESGASIPTTGLTRLTLSDAAGNQEIVTATGRAGSVLSGLTRAAESAADFPARAWAAGDFVEATLTLAGLNDALASTNPMTAQDDLIVGGASGARTRLAKGADSQVLTVDPATHHLAWATPAAGGGGFANPMTTPGDLIVGGTAGAAGRLAKGTDGQVLTVDPTTHLIVWSTPAAGGGGGMTDPLTTKGDLIVRGASATTRLAVGADGEVLTASAGATNGVAWTAPSGGGGTGLVDPTTTKGDLIVRPAQGTDRALGVIATSNEGTSTSFANLTDGNDATRFDGNTTAIPSSWFLFDLGAAYPINQWRIRQMTPADQWFATSYKWQYSTDNVTFTDADTRNPLVQDETVNMAATHTARYWKLVLLAANNPAAAWLAYTVSLFQVVAPARLPVGASGQVLSVNPAQALGIEWVTPAAGGGGGSGSGSGLYDAYVHLRDERASGTHGGDYTTGATWQTRPLQSEKDDPSNIASLASNQITLAAGTYRVQARGVTQFTGPARLRLRDVTNGATLVLGVTAGDNIGGGGYTQSDPLELSGRFTLAATTVLELQMWATYARSTFGFGAAAGTGDVEVYATVELWREGLVAGSGGPAYAKPGSMTGWAWDVQGGSTITANTNAWDMTTDTADNQIHLFYRAYPTPPFSVIAGIKPPLVGADYNAVGIGIQQGAAGPLCNFYFDVDGGLWYIRIDHWNAPGSFASRPFSRVATMRDVLLFKIEDDGTNLKFSVAHDLDYQWQQVYQEARTVFLSSLNRLGFLMQSSTGQAARSRLVHWVVG